MQAGRGGLSLGRPADLGYSLSAGCLHARDPPLCSLHGARRRNGSPRLVPGTIDHLDQKPKRGIRVANIKSQIKRNKQNEKARMRNKAVKSELKTSVRKFREAADSGDVEAATLAMRAASVKLDKAVSKGVIHKNQAANRKSAIARRAEQLKQA
jgi:small subunit ribosomal protein S20